MKCRPPFPRQSYDAAVLLREGESFSGYLIERRLGAGGMGEVYLARHPRLPRRDALKVLPAGFSGDDEFRQRFHREADLAAALYHPHIVGVHDRGEFDGKLWIAMDYVDGPDTAALLQARPGGFAIDDVRELLDAMADAVDYAHANGLLHRDIKPSNVLTSRPKVGRRRILLTDFGIARELDEVSGLTATNMTVGTVNYCPPEQLTGETINERTDQYALAATTYHWLTGSAPFAHTNPAVVIGKHLSAPPPPISSRQPELAALEPVFARALAKTPSDRYATCADFAAAFTESVDVRRPLSRDVVRRTRSTDDTLDARVVKAAADPTKPAGAPAAQRSAPKAANGHRATSRRTVLVAAGAAATAAAVIAATIFINGRHNQAPTAAATSTPASPVTTTTVVASPAATPPPPPVSTPPAPTTSYALPACYTKDYPPQGQPLSADIVYCADGGAQLTHMTWTSWASDGANGKGYLSVKTCQPDCADGGTIDYPVMIRASSPEVPPVEFRCSPNGAVYSDLTLVFTTATVPHDVNGLPPNTTYQGMPAIAFSTDRNRTDAVTLSPLGCW